MGNGKREVDEDGVRLLILPVDASMLVSLSGLYENK